MRSSRASRSKSFLLLSYENHANSSAVASIYCRHGSRTATVRFGAGMDVAVLAGRGAGDRCGLPAWRRAPTALPRCNRPALEIWHGAERESTLLKFDDGATVVDAAIAPDGTRIAVIRLSPPPTRSDADFGTDLYLVGADGSNPQPLVRRSTNAEFIETPVWLPSGNELAYTITTVIDAENFDRRIEVVDVATGARRRLLNDADQGALMPDGSHMIARVSDFRPGRSGESPVVIELQTGRANDLPGYGTLLVFIGSFARSPDGKLIAFSGADAPLAAAPRGTRGMTATTLHPILQDVWLMQPDGSGLRRLAELAINQPSLAWSEDGAFIYAMASVAFWRINAQTGELRKLGPGLPYGHIQLLPSR